MKPYRLIVYILLFLILISACANERVTTQSIQIASNTPTKNKTSVSVPSLTPLPSSTFTLAPTASKTATITQTPTNTPTVFFGFESARVYKAFAYENETIFYFIVKDVTAPYYGNVDGHPLICEPDLAYQNSLTCRCPDDLFGKDMMYFEFYADEAKTFLVYIGEFSTLLNIRPPTPTIQSLFWPRANFTSADITWGETPADCPARGVGLVYETEYRKYSDDSCLVGMTCTDSCGFYYSVDTIKDKQGDWIGVGSCW